MTTTEQKLTLAREALELAKNNHGVMLMSDPPQDAWKARGVDAAIRRALDAIATESAPAAKGLSVAHAELTDRFAALSAQSISDGMEIRQLREVVAYEQRHAARSEVALAEEKDRADRAEAALAQQAAQPAVDIERVRDLVREYAKVQMPMAREMVWDEIAGLLSQDKLTALAQRAAGDDDLPPLTMAVYGTREMLEQERQRRAQLAARAVGGVDAVALDASMDELEDAAAGYEGALADAVRKHSATVRALLASAPAAPVGDGDERALYTCIGKGGEYEVIGTSHPAGQLRGIVDSFMTVYRDTATGRLYHRIPPDFEDRMQRIDRAALTQQKGS